MSVANTLKTPIVAPGIDIQYAGAGGPGSGVSSLNALTGALNIAGAGGISVAAAGSTITITGGGGPPGLYLPLAGGTMDASPAGVINAHTITGLTTLEGDSAGNDLSILTQAGGGDIAIDATASGGSLFVDAFSTSITTGTTAGAKVDINGKLVVVPPGGYAYATNPEVAIKVQNWNNPTGNNQFGIVSDLIVATGAGSATGITASTTAANGTGNAVGIRSSGVNADTGNATGIDIDSVFANAGQAFGETITNIIAVGDVNAIGGGNYTSTGASATGINMSSISGATNADGIKLNTITGSLLANGIDIQNVLSDNQVVGISANTMTSGAGNAYGMILNTMVGPAGCKGAVINGVDAASNPGSGATAIGIESAGIFADGEVVGIDTFKIAGNNTAPVWGIRVRDVRGADNVTGIGGNDVVGMEIIDIRDEVGAGPSTGIRVGKIYNNNNNGTSLGMRINDVNNDTAAGIYMQSILAQTNGKGVSVNEITAKGEAVGYYANNINGDNDNACGIRVISPYSANNTAFGADLQKIQAPAGEAYGVRTIDVLGSAKTFGLYAANVSSANATAYGNILTSVSAPAGEAYGHYMSSVNGDAKTFGSYINGISSANSDAFGQLLSGISSAGDAHGQIITSVASTTLGAEGLNINSVSGVNTSYGINIDNLISSAGSVYGVRIGPGLNSSDNNGFVQEGTPGNKVYNKLDNELRVGIYEDTSTGVSLKVYGNVFYSGQLINNPGQQIIENKGNLVVVQNIGGPYSVVLPAGTAQEGHQFTICMRSLTSVSFTAGGGILVNGATSWACPGIISNNYRMLQAFYTSAAGVGEWLIG